MESELWPNLIMDASRNGVSHSFSLVCELHPSLEHVREGKIVECSLHASELKQDNVVHKLAIVEADLFNFKW